MSLTRRQRNRYARLSGFSTWMNMRPEAEPRLDRGVPVEKRESQIEKRSTPNAKRNDP